MGQEATHQTTSWSVWYTLAGISASLLALDYVTDHGHGGIVTEAVQHSFNRSGIGTLITQIDGGWWDPEDPDDFKKLIRLLLALGMSPALIESLSRAKKGDADRWAQGEAPDRHPTTIVDPLIRVMRRLISRS